MPEIGNARDLAFYRLEQAEECLKVAKQNCTDGYLKASANRSYYCIFHCMRAVLATCRLDSKKHSGVISIFRQEFIKTGIFPIRFSKMIGEAFELRGLSDYDDFYVAARADILQQIDNAEDFLHFTKEYLSNLTSD